MPFRRALQMQRHRSQPHGHRVLGPFAQAFVEARSDKYPGEFLELAWIDRKKPIWSTS
jgi:hypothetical protein